MSNASLVERPSPRRSRSRDLILGTVALVVVGGVVPLVVARHFGAFGISRNDDWAYARAAFDLAEHGTLDGGHWIATTLVGQLYASLPIVWVFGRSLRALQVATVVTGVVGLFAVRSLAMRLLSVRRALFVALIVAVGPMWAPLVVSYMTDIPAFSLANICLALGARGIRSDRVSGAFVAALVAGVCGFTIREYALVAPIAVLIAAIWSGRRWESPRRRQVVVATIVFALAVALFYAWRLGLPNWYHTKLRLPDGESIATAEDFTGRFALLLGGLVAPAVILSGPVSTVRTAFARMPRTTLLTLGLVGAWLVRVIVQSWRSAGFLGRGNYVAADGPLGTDTLAGTRGLLIGRPLLVVAAIVSLCSVLVLVCFAITALSGMRERAQVTSDSPRMSPVTMVVGLAVLGNAGSFVLTDVFSQPTFDRYLLPLVPLVAILVLAHAPRPTPSEARRNRVAAFVAFIALAAFGAVYAINSASFDGTRWRVAEQALRVAGRPVKVDGGYEWTGFHGHFLTFDAQDACVKLSAEPDEPVHDAAVINAESVWGPLGPQSWIVARKTRPC